jgi:hypothetical protein
VSRGPDREASIERLLRRSLKSQAVSVPQGPCLDAETLAAWVDGTMTADELGAAETHLSDCGRCLALLATMVKTSPAVPPVERWWKSSTVRWVVPLMAGATAIVFWVALPSDDRSRSPEQMVARTETVPAAPRAQTPSVGQQSQTAEADGKLLDRSGPGEHRSAGRTDNLAGKPEPAGEATETASARQKPAAGGALQETVTTSGETPVAAPPRAAAVAPVAASADSLNRSNAAAMTVMGGTIEIVSPNPAIRWRIGARGFVQVSRDRGTSWEPLASGVTTDLTAGAAPSPFVCWLVGRAGTVLLTTDARTWQRVTFPEPVDLASVRATDARQATVTAGDGRTFTTTDGGRTWNR